MPATKTAGQGHDQPRQSTRLDDRYGNSGISAVAAVVRHQGGKYSQRENGKIAERRN